MASKVTRPRRKIPVPVTSKYKASSKGLSSSHSQSSKLKTCNKFPSTTLPTTLSTENAERDVHNFTKSSKTIEVKGPFKPNIVAKFNTNDVKPRRRIKSSESAISKAEKINSMQAEVSSCKAQLGEKDKENEALQQENLQMNTKLKELEGENDNLTCKVTSIESKLKQCQDVVQRLKVDPVSLEAFALDEEELKHKTEEAVAKTYTLKQHLIRNIEVNKQMCADIKEILND